MLSTTFMLLISSAMIMLRLGDNASSFPRPLKAEEEGRGRAVLRQRDFSNQGIVDMAMYALLREEYLKGKEK